MVMLPPFATVDDLIDTLKQPALNRDTAQSALRRASGAIRLHCGWSISTETLTGVNVTVRRWQRRFWLPTLNLVSVNSLTEDGVVLTPGDAFSWESTGLVVRASGVWSWNYNGIVVGYTHGFPDGDFRIEAARDVCLSAAARLVGNPGGHSQEQTGSESWTATRIESLGTLTQAEKDDLHNLTLEDP